MLEMKQLAYYILKHFLMTRGKRRHGLEKEKLVTNCWLYTLTRVVKKLPCISQLLACQWYLWKTTIILYFSVCSAISNNNHNQELFTEDSSFPNTILSLTEEHIYDMLATLKQHELVCFLRGVQYLFQHFGHVKVTKHHGFFFVALSVT